jgi:ubiquinone/menaquinone biosynthesis C-methylase UbiE
MTALDVGCGMGFFSIAMARMIGDEGRVIAVDLQQEMLDVLLRRARRKGVADRIRAQRCAEDELGVEDEVDFALAFCVVHETPDPTALARQVRRCLKPGGKLLVAEPVFHVSRSEFRDTEATIGEAGLRPCDRPRIRFCRAAVFDSP